MVRKGNDFPPSASISKEDGFQTFYAGTRIPGKHTSLDLADIPTVPASPCSFFTRVLSTLIVEIKLDKRFQFGSKKEEEGEEYGRFCFSIRIEPLRKNF